MGNGESQNGNGAKSSGVWKVTLIICVAVVMLAAMVIGYFVFKKTVDTPKEYVSEAMKYLAERREVGVRVGNYLKETSQQRFQFKQRELLLTFQIIRWLDKDNQKRLEEVPHIIKLEGKDILLRQYTIAEARGDFEITFFIELKDQKKWKYEWNGEKKQLTIVVPKFAPPNVGCNTPAGKSPMAYEVKIDCLRFVEGRTLELLKNAIPRLKKKAALRQLQYLREDARKSLKDFFSGLLPRMTNTKDDITVKVVFNDELPETATPQKY